ncbi:MAG: hypothetical protein UH625_07640 [Muribaculaceae bacterium]|nr:hypothetical protein [Muribaculaceae bacterium]
MRSILLYAAVAVAAVVVSSGCRSTRETAVTHDRSTDTVTMVRKIATVTDTLAEVAYIRVDSIHVSPDSAVAIYGVSVSARTVRRSSARSSDSATTMKHTRELAVTESREAEPPAVGRSVRRMIFEWVLVAVVVIVVMVVVRGIKNGRR